MRREEHDMERNEKTEEHVKMDEDLSTDYVEFCLEREVHMWYKSFTEYWTVSVNIDEDWKEEDAVYSVRVVGEQGEVSKTTQLDPDEVDDQIRNRFEHILMRAKTSV